MKTMWASLCLAEATLWASAAGAQTPPDSAWTRYPAATEVVIEDAAARVIIEPQMRGDSAIVIVNPGPLPTPEVRLRGERLTVDGTLRRVSGCDDDGSVEVRGHGRLRVDQLPIIYVRTPDSLVFTGEGGLRIETGPSNSARVTLAGCSVATLGPVADRLTLALAGDARVVSGPSARARVALAGGGSIDLGPVAQDLDVSIAGDGSVDVGAVNGPVRVAIQGDGQVRINGGEVESFRVAIAGDGRVWFNGEAQDVSAAIAGSGLVTVASVQGEVEQRVAGSGAVRIGATPPPPAPPARP